MATQGSRYDTTTLYVQVVEDGTVVAAHGPFSRQGVEAFAAGLASSGALVPRTVTEIEGERLTTRRVVPELRIVELVVDGSPTDRSVLRELLLRAGEHVVEHANGRLQVDEVFFAFNDDGTLQDVWAHV